jgi:signal transduction histidine kinase
MEYAEAEGAKDIASTVMQMSQMIEDILAKSRQKKSPEAIDFNALIQRELDFLQANPGFKHDVDKQVSLAENLPVTMGIYTDFSQIFGNLLRNAVDAMHDSDQKQLSVRTALDGEHIMVEIADSGCGIPSSILPQLFEPFFTTKSSNGEDGKPMGTGLGLYTVRELLEARDATIEVESEEEQGTLFRVRIPVVL